MQTLKTVSKSTGQKPDDDLRNWMLDNARSEAKADALVGFSSHLDKLAMHAADNYLSSVEIIELLRQESENFDNQSRAHKAEAQHYG